MSGVCLSECAKASFINGVGGHNLNVWYEVVRVSAVTASSAAANLQRIGVHALYSAGCGEWPDWDCWCLNLCLLAWQQASGPGDLETDSSLSDSDAFMEEETSSHPGKVPRLLQPVKQGAWHNGGASSGLDEQCPPQHVLLLLAPQSLACFGSQGCTSQLKMPSLAPCPYLQC